ncbi:MAG: flippase-like domain-containing protein [Reichenbachiella sp.]
MKWSNVLKYFISLVLAGVLFYLVFRDISLDDFISRLKYVNYWWVLLSIGLAIVSHWLRAYRWNLMLKPFGYHLKTHRTFLAVMSGYLANLALPRLGEITRCGLLKKNDSVSMSTAFGTVVIERLIDFMILLGLIMLDFIIEFDKIYNYFLDSVGWTNIEDHATSIYLSIIVIISLGVIGILILKNLLVKEFSHPTLNKINQKLNDLVQGFLSIRNIENIPGFIYSTFGIWIAYFLMSYVIFFSMPETSNLTIGAGLSILAAAGVAMAAPVQGGIGAYHALVSGVLMIYGVGDTTSKFFATMLHTSQVIFILVFGGACMFISTFISKKNQTDLGSKP